MNGVAFISGLLSGVVITIAARIVWGWFGDDE